MKKDKEVRADGLVLISRRWRDPVKHAASHKVSNARSNLNSNPVTQFIKRTFGSYIKVADRTPEQIDAINTFKQERDMDYVHPVTGKRMAFRTLEETSAQGIVRDSARNHLRSTIDGIRAHRTTHLKAGRITPTEEDNMAHDPEAYAADPEMRAARKILNAKTNPDHSPTTNAITQAAALRTTGGNRSSRAWLDEATSAFRKAALSKQKELWLASGKLYINAAGLLRLTDGTDRGPAPEAATERSGSPEANKQVPRPAIRGLNRTPHIGRGLGIRTGRKTMREGMTNAERNLTVCYIYIIQPDPVGHPYTFKIGLSQQAPDKYAIEWQKRLDPLDPYRNKLYFLLIYVVELDGAIVEEDFMRAMKDVADQHLLDEWFLFNSVDAACTNFSGIAGVMGYELYHDDRVWQASPEGIKSLTMGANCAKVGDHAL